MHITPLKTIRLERYFIALLMTVAMFAFAQFSGQKEIIFPEILAIMTGAWVCEIMPWNVNKRKMFVLISLSAFLGVSIVNYVHLPLFYQVFICFVSIGMLLFLAKTTFIPVISACILPVYLQTSSFIYAYAVTFMAFVIIFAQYLMEKNHMRPINHYSDEDFNIKIEGARWVKLFLIFGIISALPIASKNIFFLAPPLIVTFTEFANPKSPLRKKAFDIFLLMVYASTLGTILKLIFNLYLHFPLLICAILACVLLFIVFDYFKIQFPPSGAILLLPMILEKNDLILFPLEVAIGCAILIPLAMFLFKAKK